MPELPNNSDESQLPPLLAEDLDAIYGRIPATPRAVDHAIIAAARLQLAGARRRRLWLGWGGGAAIAAAVLLCVTVVGPLLHRDRAQLAAAPRFDARGHVITILDAFYLARQLRDHAGVDRSWDVNGDGAIDQKDVDAIASMAVQLGPPEQKRAMP